MNYIERYWRDATPADAIKEPPMVARFDNDKTPQGIERLTGFRRLKNGSLVWYAGDGRVGVSCQVYDAPDPGEGWRLIDTENEQPQDGDEFLGKDDVWIRKLSESNTGFSDEFIYRRRITPAVTYVPFTWEDREQLRGRWIYRSKDGNTIEEIAFKFDSRVFNEVAKHLLEDGWRFLDTGKPVGKEVAQ